MKDQHKKIKGYRDLSAEEIELMNEIKEKAEEIRVLIDKIEKLKSPIAPDKWWVHEGKMGLQKGFMYLIRSIAKPSTF